MERRILSLDVASKTGWAFIDLRNLKLDYGLIVTSSKFPRAERLSYFRNEFKNLLLKLKPTHVVMEDIYGGYVNAVILLAKFSGVVEECCMSILNIEPYIIHTNTVKAYFKVKTKEELFDFVADIIDWEDAKFKRDNDIVDAVAQLMVFCDEVLKFKRFRKETEYGFVYGVNYG